VNETPATISEPPRALGTLPPRAPRVGDADRATPLPPASPSGGGLAWAVAIVLVVAVGGALAFFLTR
jgi:hypothetical protein